MAAAPDFIVAVERPAWRRAVPALARFARAAARAAHDAAVKAGAPPLQGEVTLAFADDAAIQGLNHTFRGKNKPTNVLSFPAAGGAGGDVILALETIRAEADLQGKTMADHAAHLIVHGILHLMGYDHMARGDARRMESLERRVLAGLGIGDPYA